MANSTPCQTPGANFMTSLRTNLITCVVDLPFHLDLTEAEAELLETNLHNALELVLARYFDKANVPSHADYDIIRPPR